MHRWCTDNVCSQGCPSIFGLVLWPKSPCQQEVKPIIQNYGVYMHVKCGFPWGMVLILVVLALCCGAGCVYNKQRKTRRSRWGPQNSVQQPFRDSMF